MIDSGNVLARAVRQFWLSREDQLGRQGVNSGVKDTGNRAAVTGGKHADGFASLISEILQDAGLDSAAIHVMSQKPRTLPGYFRPSKTWDVVVTHDVHLVAVIEIKTQVGSFGNNYNNRVEEAVGSATDLWAAYKAGLFKSADRPWVGYMFMLESAPKSVEVLSRIDIPRFAVDEDFQTLSYAKRYELTCLRLLRERLYDAACFFTSNRETGTNGAYQEPNPELGIASFTRQLRARASSFVSVL
jgi:hypothetical protein